MKIIIVFQNKNLAGIGYIFLSEIYREVTEGKNQGEILLRYKRHINLPKMHWSQLQKA